MRICLIIPPSPFLLDERVFMNLGILKVGSYLETRNYEVSVLDLSGVTNYPEVLARYVELNPEVKVFGVTSATAQFPAASKIARILKWHNPTARLILGGPHITLICAALKREKKLGMFGRARRHFTEAINEFDCIVAGDGEFAIERAIHSTDIYVDADDPKSELFLSNKNFEELPFPGRHLIDVDSYHYSFEGRKALSLIAQLGCPFACGFCSGRTSPMLRKIRLRSSQSVLQELEHLYLTYNATAFMFYDDELNVNPQMIPLMNGIIDLQSRLGVEFRFRGCIKSQLFTPEQAERMYAAGFRQILVGFESGNERILENINKKATKEENTRCVETAKNAGIKTKALMSIGHPGESFETVEDTLNWIVAMEPEDFNITIITCAPGTFYYDYAVQVLPRKDAWTYTAPSGDRLHSIDIDYSVTSDYYNGRPGDYRSFVFTDYMSPDDLVSARDFCESMARNVLKIPYPRSTESLYFDQSMGQQGPLPKHILK